MTQLLGVWQRALDANGNPYSGALLYTYDSVATTTPKTTYKDAELTLPHTNPIVASSTGEFAQIFVSPTASYYLALKTATGSLVKAYEDVEGVGSAGTGGFTVDFGPGGRFQASGSMGTVSLEAGDQANDDVGGTMRIGGWESTQGDDLELDFSSITTTGDFDVVGDVSATGALSGDTLTLGGIVRAVPTCTARGVVTAAATTDLTLDGDYEAWEIHIRNYQVLGVSGGTPSMRLSFDGSTYKATSGDYSYGSVIQSGSTATAVGWAATATYIPIGNANSNASGTGGGGDIIIRITSTAAHETRYRADFLHYSVSASGERTSGWIAGSTPVKSYGKVAKVRIFDIVGGNLTFDYAVIGLP